MFTKSKMTPFTEEEILLQPLHHLKQTSKSFFVMKLVHGLNGWFKVPEDKIKEIISTESEAAIFGFIIDDLEDYSKIRNGILTSHLVYGRSRTLIAAVNGIAMHMEKLLNFPNLEIVDYFIDMSINGFKGQALDIYYRDNMLCPTEEEYTEMIMGKTHSFIVYSMEYLRIFASEHVTTNMENFAKSFSLFIQILNDYISLKSSSNAAEKSFAEDVSEGKFSYPIIHAIRNHPEDKQIMDILKQRTLDYGIKKIFVDLLEKYGSFDYTMNTLVKLQKECLEEIEKIGENEQIEELLKFCLDNIDVMTM